jgi:hypothetical protein
MISRRSAVCCREGTVDCLVSKLCVADAKSSLRSREERREKMPGLEESLFRRDEAVLAALVSSPINLDLPLALRFKAKSEDVDGLTSSAELICSRALPQAFSRTRRLAEGYDNVCQCRQAFLAIFDFATR